MKRNTIIKVMSATILAASLAVVDFSTNSLQIKYTHAVDTQEASIDVPAQLLNANHSGQLSMGNAALEKVTVKKIGGKYQYTVIWKDLKFGEMTDGVSRFWVEGNEITLTSVNYPNVENPKQAIFTLSELKSSINVQVFVQTMENISPGAGTKDAILNLDISNVEKQLEVPTTTTSTYIKNTQAEKLESENKENNNHKYDKTSIEKSETESPAPQKTTTQQTNNNVQPSISSEVTYYDNVAVSLMNASEYGKKSLGDAALDGITVFKDSSDNYHYIIRFHDISIGKLSDGISRFWVNGTEYPVVPTGGANNQAQVHFTSTEKLTSIPVSVFVQTMENIMPGAGTKDAILTLDWSASTERKGQADISGGNPGTNSGSPVLSSKGGRFNNNSGRLAKTGLDTTSTLFAGIFTLFGAILISRKRQK